MKLKRMLFGKLNLDKKYNGVISTTKQYFDLPKEEREVKKWYWPSKLFLWPFAMSARLGRNPDSDDFLISEWQLFYEEIRKEYPVQSLFRLFHDTDFYRFFSHRYYNYLINIYYPVKNFFFPRNKYLTKLIPNGYVNESELMEKLLYAFFLKTYDAGIDGWRDPKDEVWSKKVKEFDDCANWIKVEKAVLENKIKEAWDKIPVKPKKGLTYEEIYGEIDALEKELNDKTTHWMNYIVQNREIFN